MKKKERLRLHARQRFRLRCETELTDDLHSHLVQKIQRNECPFVRRQSRRVTIFETTLDDTGYHLVYDSLRKQIVTILYASKEDYLNKKTKEEKWFTTTRKEEANENRDQQ